MIKRTRAKMAKCILHKVGNKFNSAVNVFSDNEIIFDEDSYEMLLPFLLRPFQGVIETYRFNHHSDIAMNELNIYSSEIIKGEESFVDISKNIVKHLYEQSNSANIKIGDVLIVKFEDIEYKDTVTEAVGIFKIENKHSFFQTYQEDDSIDIVVQKGISTKRLDKGCLILNYADDEGRVVLSVDTNNYDALYWINNFLNIKYADDSNHHTKNYINLCKEFSEDVIKEEFGLQKQGQFLAKTVDFLKENDNVNIHDFKSEIFEEETHEALFDDFKERFEEDYDVQIRNQFPISEVVLKKEKRKIKNEINLDTNIQIKVDVDDPDAATEYLERGYDETKKMKYYKVYFNDEE